MIEYLDTKGLAYFWKGTKKVFVKKVNDKANQYIRTIDDSESKNTVFAITDSESNVLFSIDEDVISRFPSITVDNNLTVNGTTNNNTVLIEDCKIV